MDPNTLQLILLIEGLVALAAKSVIDLKTVLSNTNTQTVEQIVADADAQYQLLINKIKS